MPIPSTELLAKLGPPAKPFGRRIDNSDLEIQEGEDLVEPFVDFIFDATNGGFPPSIPYESIEKFLEIISLEKVQSSISSSEKYLWIIDEKGLRMVEEMIPNPFAARGYLCHTNITGGKPALQGGELWFETEKKVLINFKSGRYGATTLLHRQAVVEYFTYIGYEVELLPIEK